MLLLGHIDLGDLSCHRGCGDIQPKLLPRAMSRSIILLKLGFLLMSVAHVTTEGHKNHV